MKGQDSLELFDFGVLLQALSNNLKIGVLAVRSGRREKFLHLDRTRLRCVYTARPRVSLQKVLFNHRSVSREVLRQAAEVLGPGRTEPDLAEWLLAHGQVTTEQLRRAHTYQVVEEVLELFYWKSVGFEFYSGDESEFASRVHDGGFAVVGQSVATDTILIQCTKITDDIAKFNSVTPSLRDVYELHFESLDELEQAVPDRGQREFMLLIDGVRDMREVLRDMRMNRFEVLELFYRLRNEGRIRPKNSFELLMLAENRKSEFSLEKRARVLERVNELGVEGFGVVLPLAETYEALGQTQKASDCYRRHAQLCAEQDHVDTALASIERAVQLAPEDAAIRRIAVELLERDGRRAEAAAAYKALAEIHRAGGDLEGARVALESGVRTSPDDAVLRRRLGEILAEQGRHREAAVQVRRAGDAHIRAGDAKTAADCFRRALALWPRGWNARFRLAAALHAARRDDMAIQALSDAARFVVDDMHQASPELRVTLLQRIETQLRESGGLASSAAGHLAAAFRREGCRDDAVRVLTDSAVSLAAANRHRSAVEIYADLVDLRPDDVEARRGWAQCHAALGDRNRAVAQLRRAAKQLCASGEWTLAGVVYSDMLDVDPGCLDAHIGLAQALLNAGQSARASEHFHRAGLLHRGCGREAEALPYFREAVEKRPADSALLDEYCELLLAVGDDSRESLAALNALVQLRMQRDEHALAAMALSRILAIDPRYPGAKSILQEAARELRRLSEDSEEFTPAEAQAIVAEAKARADAAGS